MKLIQILVVEDNEADVMLFHEALMHYRIEHQLNHVADGQAALDYVTRIGTGSECPCPDVVLLDLNLPKADGLTVLEQLRQHPQGERVPVIVVTSSDAERDRARVAAYDATRYFRKPSDFDAFIELGAVVRDMLAGAK